MQETWLGGNKRVRKVLFIVPDFYPNSTGFANAALNLINSIKSYGNDRYDIGVFTTIPLGNNNELAEMEIVRYKNTIPDNRITHAMVECKKYNELHRFISRFNPDVIFFETNTFPFVETWVVKEFQEKVFVRIHSTADTEVPIFGAHNTLLARIEYKKMKEFMKLVPNILSTSNFYLDFVKRYYLDGNAYSIWDNKSYGVLYNTAGSSDSAATCQTTNRFMTMGKMSDNGATQKGITDLLKAVYYLERSDSLPADFELIVVGTGSRLNYIKNMISNLALGKYINLIESAPHEEVFELIKSSKAIILLSRYEGQSMFVTESISLGKPLIISDNNGMQDMLREGVNGFKVKTGDSKDAAQKIQRMMNLSDEELQSFSQASLNLYNSQYSDVATYNQFDEIMNLYFSQLSG